MATDMTVANTILAQLGGAKRLTAMIGAKNFVGDRNSLRFQWAAKSTNRANVALVRLDPSDTYTVEFWRRQVSTRKGIVVEKVEELSNLHAEDLIRAYEKATGLALRF